MGFGKFLDRAIAPFAPAHGRAAHGGALGPEAAAPVRRRRDLAAHPQLEAAADRRRRRKLARSRAAARQRARPGRNNKYIAAGVRHLVADLIGDGIAPHFTHADPASRRRPGRMEALGRRPVDGHGDFYGFQKTAAWETVVGGEMLTVWKPDANGPDGRIEGIEGDQLDESRSKTCPTAGASSRASNSTATTTASPIGCSTATPAAWRCR
jgi:hypothetical protein